VAFAAAAWVFSCVFAASQSYRFLFVWSGFALLAGALAQRCEARKARRFSETEASCDAA
jgi:hypothetical protein